ncbi:SpoIIE family protein phosphatase [Streptomyces nigra]|uniref:SpoIIE family protein phosphatase n=1 Tax=Streptomyces nigra TaxID=1827580 RepID=UPI003633F438
MLCGLLTWVNRGHHLPMLIRDNRRTTHLSCPWAGPMGADLGLPVATATEQLEPGDRLLLYTDGIVEARAGDGSSAGTGSSTSSAATTPADTPCTRHLPADDRGHAAPRRQPRRRRHGPAHRMARWPPGGVDPREPPGSGHGRGHARQSAACPAGIGTALVRIAAGRRDRERMRVASERRCQAAGRSARE